MIDIVERLRDTKHHPWEICQDAADEITRLRAEIDNIKQVEFPRRVDKVADGWRNKCDLAEAEIARLRNENESLASNLRGKHATTGATYAHLIAERDRLRDENVKVAMLMAQLAERIETAKAEEREACAKVCEEIDAGQSYYADSIRARKR